MLEKERELPLYERRRGENEAIIYAFVGGNFCFLFLD